MTTIFNGAFAPSLGGFFTVRGYAPLRDIAKCSFADSTYQRNLKSEHVEDIKKYFTAGEYLFFPEIILSATLDLMYEDAIFNQIAGVGNLGTLQSLLEGATFESNVNGLKIRPYEKNKSGIQRFSLSVPEDETPFKRIDGNHRLTAYETLTDTRYDNYVAPFCIILFDEKDAPRNEKALFHNINSKALPLTSEESLAGIIDDKHGFPDGELHERFGPAFLQCRELKSRLDFSYLANLKTVFGKDKGQRECMRSVLIQSLKDVHREIDSKTRLDTEAVFEAIKSINDTYSDKRLKASTSQGLFAAFLFFQLNTDRSRGTYEQFMNWVLRTHQYELQSVNAADLINIFGKIAQSRKRQVFVSMQFSAETRPNYEAIKSAVDDLNKEHNLDIAIRPIRIDQFDTGFSYVINDEILRLIEDSGYLIADLTCGNKNVYHEIGYLMGLNRAKGLKDENFLLIHNGKIGDSEKDIGFNIKNIKQERKDDTNSLREAVKRQMAVYFKLTEKVES